MGRPRIHEKRCSLNLTLEAEVSERAKIAAKARGLSLSQYVSALLLKDIGREGAPLPKGRESGG